MILALNFKPQCDTKVGYKIGIDRESMRQLHQFQVLTVFFISIENEDMTKHDFLHVGICKLEPVQVIYKTCLFRDPPQGYDKRLRQTFQLVREWIVRFGLDPMGLLHIGIPTLENKQLIMYDCCIEFPLPMMEKSDDLALRSLQGGDYALLRVEKTPAKIGKAIQMFLADYIPENHLVLDEERPIYEIYYTDTIEYCVPILE
jgi:DNA gyrase inhibitor GyrI